MGTMIEKVKQTVHDGWSNLITGLNSAKTAKKLHTRATASVLLTDDELQDIYIDDGLGARIVDLLPSDMFREEWEFSFPKLDELDAEQFTDVYKEVLEAIGAHQKLKEGFQWARLHGGAVILIGVTDGKDMEKPLEPSRIKTFEKLKVIDRSCIDFSKIQFETNPKNPRYGLPVLYPIKFDINSTTQDEHMVHHTRIIEIHGAVLPRKTRGVTEEYRYWGVSVLQRAESMLNTIGSSIGSIDQLLQEVSVGKFKIKDLAILLSTEEGKAAIQRRVELMDVTRSVFRSQYFDSEEDFTRDNVSFAGVPEVLYILFMLISSITGYPITRLFGVSPGGMNATGESDMRNYYDMVRSEQTNSLQPVLLRIVRIISEWKKIEEPYIEFLPLQTMTEKEQADIDKLTADKEQVEANTYKTYIDAGIMEPYEARWLKFGDTLDNIPVPEDMLPPVQTAPELPGPDDDNADPEGKPEEGVDGE